MPKPTRFSPEVRPRAIRDERQRALNDCRDQAPRSDECWRPAATRSTALVPTPTHPGQISAGSAGMVGLYF
jgi:hypothetical protein